MEQRRSILVIALLIHLDASLCCHLHVLIHRSTRRYNNHSQMPVVPHRLKDGGESAQSKRQIELPAPFETPTRAVPLPGGLDDPIATPTTARATEVTPTSAITTPRTTSTSITVSVSASTSSLSRATVSPTSTRITTSSTQASTSSSSAQSSSAKTSTATTTASSGGSHSLICEYDPRNSSDVSSQHFPSRLPGPNGQTHTSNIGWSRLRLPSRQRISR